MHLSKDKIYILVAIAAVYFGWQHLSRTAHETVVLHIPPAARSQDTYVNLWIAEDAQNIWVRAESPSRLWLDYLHDKPVVQLLRHDGTYTYRAYPEDIPSTRAHVDEMFREKYGLADELRALVRSETVPVRLVRP
jgi:hypothetical protein